VFLCMVFLLVILVIATIFMVQVNAKIEINFMLEPNIVKIQQLPINGQHLKHFF
jgi:hypothetical protein